VRGEADEIVSVFPMDKLVLRSEEIWLGFGSVIAPRFMSERGSSQPRKHMFEILFPSEDTDGAVA
jgi:hypothetical protein